MTPKEKAKELLWQYLPILEGWTDNGKTELAKQCALIAVDEIIKEVVLSSMYWQEVKQEIEAL